MATPNPRLSVRAYAELLDLPAVQQYRVLNDQKYPRSEPQSFRVPFYQRSLQAIRDYYRSGNDPNVLESARHSLMDVRPPARRDRNLAVLAKFERSRQARRRLVLLPRARYAANLDGIELRLQFDIQASEGESARYILYYLRQVPLDAETARVTLELASWVLQESRQPHPFRALEFIDLPRRTTRRITSLRRQTLRRVRQNARIIRALWPGI